MAQNPYIKAHRMAILLDQKAALRTKKRECPSSSQKDLKIWFQEQFNYSPLSSTITEILSDKYLYLDNLSTSSSSFKRLIKRQRRENWLELEEAISYGFNMLKIRFLLV